jgi:hypothetical protein
MEAFHRHIDKGKTANVNIPAAYLLVARQGELIA